MNTSIIIPSYNEAKRLPATLKELSVQIESNSLSPMKIAEVLVIDDGSEDGTSEIAKSCNNNLPGYRVLSYNKNKGKGFAVRHGLSSANSPWVLMADADMSTPWKEAAKLARFCMDETAEIAIGSRDTLGSRILTHQSAWRENLGKTFNIFVRTLTDLPFKDTQCGFKLFSSNAVMPFLSLLTINGFAWDVELLMVAKKRKIKTIEVPIEWEHKEHSRVNPVKDGFGMVLSVIKTRLRKLK